MFFKHILFTVKKLFNRFLYKIIHVNPTAKIFFYYLLIFLIGSWLLTLPFSLKTNNLCSPLGGSGGHHWNFLNSCFIAASGFSNTGLTTTVIQQQFTTVGQVVLLILIQIGGLGFASIKLIFLFMIGRKIGIINKINITTEKGFVKIGSSYDIIKKVIIYIFIVEALFTLILGTYLFFNAPVISNGISSALHGNFGFALYYGLFHSITAVNNSGFDIFGANSLEPFSHDYFFQFCIIFLLVFGGIGFPVIYELEQFVIAKWKKLHFRFSLFSKTCVISYIFIALIGFILILNFEIFAPPILNIPHQPPTIFHNPSYTMGQKIMFCFFTVMSSRNAGFSTINMHYFTPNSILILGILMWIGASPASTAGGIRCTTVWVLLFLVISIIRRKQSVNIQKRSIPNETVIRSVAVFLIGLVLVFIGCIIIYPEIYHENATNPNINFSLDDVFFDVSSAFGTTGLSTGVVNYLNATGLIVLILLMFIGQLTISTTLLFTLRRSPESIHRTYKYASENIAIG